MAALQHGAAFTPAALGHRRFMPGKISPVISSFSTSFPIKRTGRKNHLRQKILKTLEKPIIPKLPPANPILPIDSPSQKIEETGNAQETRESGISEAGGAEVKNSEKLSEIEGSVHSGVDGNVGILPKNSILKYGLWLIGAFVFQTVCAVWFFGSADIDNKSEILDGRNEKTGSRMSAFTSNIYVDELEMERKIEEIRVMAREAREKERLESKRNGIDSEGNDGGKYSKSGIEEEVENRLVKLRKKLGNNRLKMPVVSDEKGVLDDRESNGALLFKKKYKFRGLSGDPIEKPKGFGSDDTRISSGNGDNNGNSVENQIEVASVDSNRIEVVHVAEEENTEGMLETNEPTRNTRKKVERERETSKKGKRKDAAKPKALLWRRMAGGGRQRKLTFGG